MTNDAFNASLTKEKYGRDKAWRKSVYVERGIEGTNGYPSIEIPSREEEIKNKITGQKDLRGILNNQVDTKVILTKVYEDDTNKTTN